MERITYFVGAGVYTPFVHPDSVRFYRITSLDPLLGVQVDTPQNAQRFSNVHVFDGNGNEINYLAQVQKEQS